MTPINYEQWIKDAMAAGKTAEQIAKEFTETMNAINSKKNKEEQAKQEKHYYINDLMARLDNCDPCSMSPSEIAAGIIAMFWTNNTISNWPLDKIKHFQAFVKNLVATSADTFKRLESMNNVCMGLGKMLGVDIPPADLSDKKFFEIPAVEPGTAWTASSRDLDKMAIDKFLEQFWK